LPCLLSSRCFDCVACLTCLACLAYSLACSLARLLTCSLVARWLACSLAYLLAPLLAIKKSIRKELLENNITLFCFALLYCAPCKDCTGSH
jgi:hypothetical protein